MSDIKERVAFTLAAFFLGFGLWQSVTLLVEESWQRTAWHVVVAMFAAKWMLMVWTPRRTS